MIKGRGHDSSGLKASETLPSIGCYVKDEYAEEYHVAPASERYSPKTSKKRSRFGIWLVLFAIIVVGLFVGFQRHMPAEFQFLAEAQNFGQRALSLIKFPIEELHIVGHEYTKEKVIVQRLGDIWNKSLISLNTMEAKKRIEALPWIRRAEVERVFPHGINIYVEERKPIGRFVTLSGTYVFDSSGFVIEKIKVGAHLDLPIFDGAGAPEAAEELRDILTNFDDLQPLMVRYTRVDKRRWTLVMHNEMKIFLPEVKLDMALNRLRALQGQHNILNREIAVIDLRLGDRVTLRPKNSKNIKVLSSDKDFQFEPDAKSKELTESEAHLNSKNGI